MDGDPLITEVNRYHCKKNKYIILLLLEIRNIMEFMDDFSNLNFGRDINLIHTKTNNSIDFTPVYSNKILCSAMQTLQSIYSCVEYGNLADSHILLRKYRDDLLFYVYIHLASKSFGLLDEKIDVKQKKYVKDWTKNSLSNLKYFDVITYIKNSKECQEVIKKYDLEIMLKKISKKLNDYTHSNGVTYYNQTFTKYRDDEIKSITKMLTEQLSFISIVFVVLLILVNPLAVLSDDFIDTLEMNYQNNYCIDMDNFPIEDNQQSCAAFIVEFIRKYGNLIGENCFDFLSVSTGIDF